jgi:hypothetical protein
MDSRPRLRLSRTSFRRNEEIGIRRLSTEPSEQPGAVERMKTFQCQKTNYSGYLGMLSDWGNGQEFLIREEVVVIGRKYDCDLRIDKPYVSLVHAVITRENGAMVLEDLGGRHGTRVNRLPIERRVLTDGDRIHIGQTELLFRAQP